MLQNFELNQSLKSYIEIEYFNLFRSFLHDVSLWHTGELQHLHLVHDVDFVNQFQGMTDISATIILISLKLQCAVYGQPPVI